MKIQMMKLIVNEINNIEQVKELLTALENKTTEEQIQLINALEECNYNFYALKIATNVIIIENRTTEEQIQLMKALKECNYNKEVYLIAIDTNILENRMLEQQIIFMNNLYNMKKLEFQRNDNKLNNQILQSHHDNISKILKLTQLREYVLELERQYGTDTDIFLNKEVTVYTK